MIDRRTLLAAGLGLAAAPAVAARSGGSRERPHVFTHEDDFDELWETIRDRYPFFGEKQTNWNKVRTLYRPLAIASADDAVSTLGVTM